MFAQYDITSIVALGIDNQIHFHGNLNWKSKMWVASAGHLNWRDISMGAVGRIVFYHIHGEGWGRYAERRQDETASDWGGVVWLRLGQNRQDSEWPNQRTRAVFPNVFNVTSRIERGTSIMSLTWYRKYKKKISYPWQLVGTVLAPPMSSGASDTWPVCQMPAVVTSLLPTSNGVLITVWSVSEPIPQCQLRFCFLGSLLQLTLFT